MNNIEASKMYNVKDIMSIIEKQLLEIMREDYEFYKNFEIKLSNEQRYVSPEERKEPNIIYIVVKFLPADIHFNQNVIPITINAVSEYNKIEACQRLLLEYAQVYNLADDMIDNKTFYNQTYTTPQVLSNFSEVYYGYRNTLSMAGTFLLSYNSNPSKLYYLAKIEENGVFVEKEFLIDKITFTEDFSVQADTQPFYDTNGFTTSIGKFGTHTINFSMFLVDNELCEQILRIVSGEEINGVDHTFRFKIAYNSKKTYVKDFKLMTFGKAENVGEMPVISCSFTN